MSVFQISTQPTTNQLHRLISIDSGFILNTGPGDMECFFTCDLEEKIKLTSKTNVFLSSVYISSYKLNETERTCWGENTVQVFNFDIPQFETRTVAGNSTGGKVPSHRRFSLPNESCHLPQTGGTLLSEDFKPFILGHLGQQAVYISTIQPKILTRLDVKITDQDGLSIFKALPAGVFNVDANPPIASRRVMMQFILVSEK